MRRSLLPASHPPHTHSRQRTRICRAVGRQDPSRNCRCTRRANEFLAWGAGPRASQYLVLGAKCHAAINGKYSPDMEDVGRGLPRTPTPRAPELQGRSRRHQCGRYHQEADVKGI